MNIYICMYVDIYIYIYVSIHIIYIYTHLYLVPSASSPLQGFLWSPPFRTLAPAFPAALGLPHKRLDV